ncbi:MAG: nucleoside triphosphate pyrophosphohydrolase [Planctomycetes bacterium]|nr:nucleoside triphosphate pyrophosphohydrolase [Planctomycetota bacterium]
MSDAASRVPWDGRDHASLARELGAARAASEAHAVERLSELLGVVFRLRDDDGCPWDRSQSLDSMVANLLEEAAETAEAVAERDDAHVTEELGDVLMNVLLMARIAEQERRFDLSAVATGIATKLVRRHAHVFGNVQADDADSALASWNASKAKEREGQESALHGVPSGLPALLLALRLGEKAARTGFDWPDAAGALDKLREEVDELAEVSRAASRATGAGESSAGDATSGAGAHERLEDELGDVLFAAVNVARKHRIDPELALRRTIAKFRRRFAHVERGLGARLHDATLDEMEALWRQAARAESAGGS